MLPASLTSLELRLNSQAFGLLVIIATYGREGKTYTIIIRRNDLGCIWVALSPGPEGISQLRTDGPSAIGLPEPCIGPVKGLALIGPSSRVGCPL